MKQHTNLTKWIATAVAVVGGLSLAGSVHAQAVTGDASLDNLDLNPADGNIAYYAGWSAQPPTIVNDGPAGLEINALTAYGSLYYNVAGAGQLQTLNPNDNQATLVLTFNNPSSPPGAIGGNYWFGIPFILNDNAGAITYGGYTGEFTSYNPTASQGSAVWNGNTVTETVPLDPTQIAAIQNGNDTVYGFNLEFAPAIDPDGFSDITFNSLTLSSSVPEPSTLALIGSGAAALLSFRRRK